MRRYRSMMDISSLGIVAFGVWSIIKLVLTAMGDPNHFINNVGPDQGAGRGDDILTVVFLAIITAIDMSMRLYIARSARKVSKGEIKKTRYIIFAIVLMLTSAFSIFLQCVGIHLDPSGWVSYFVSILVELTSLGAVAELIYASVRFRKARDLFNGREIKPEGMAA